MPRLVVTAACALALAAPVTAVSGAAAVSEVDGVYVVVLADDPRATPVADQRATQDRLLASIGADGSDGSEGSEVADGSDGEPLYRYTSALSGFAIRLDPAQVKQLQADPAVLAVQPSRRATLDSVAGVGSTSAATGSVSGPPPDSAPGHSDAGKGVVIAIVDSGIWPENPTFAAAALDPDEVRRSHPRFRGGCATTGEQWNEQACNAKVIGARAFVEAFGADQVAAAEYLSPRDAAGHGSHVASTAAGNSGVSVTVGQQEFGQISGEAPAAALSIYKACWVAPDPADDGCETADVVAAIDTAVADRVDVLNLALSDTDESASDPVELALLNAAAAGIVVTASAGDGGPGPGTVAHPGPWVTTVGATTGAGYPGEIRLGDGRRLTGSMVSAEPVPVAPLVRAADAAAPGATRRQASRCYTGALDAAQVDDAVVICTRGGNARLSKGVTVEQAGGRAMILANGRPGAIEADIHQVPAVHVDKQAATALDAYLRSTRRPTASLRPLPSAGEGSGPAHFSARGPVRESGADVGKPDLAASGENVIGAVSPPADFGRRWDLASGTSMAAAEAAGAAAAVVAVHPDWSPAAVKSALMTTAGPVAGRADPFATGAGILRPDAASDPGLVYDTGAEAWRRYVRAQGVPLATRGKGAPTVDGSDLNLASVTVGSLVGEQRIKRRVTNVSHRTETYTGDVSGLRGVAARVSPASFRLAPGESTTYRLTMTARRSARYGDFTAGAITWTGSRGHVVTSPVVVRPETVRTVDEVSGSGSVGELTVRADAGITANLRPRLVGPVAATPQPLTLLPSTFDPQRPAAADEVWSQDLDVPAATLAVRWQLSGAADVDLYVYRGAELVGSSAGTGADEQVTLLEPARGHYRVVAVAPDLGAAAPVAASFARWLVTKDHGGSRLITGPDRIPVTGGQRFGIDLSWRDLDVTRRWLAVLRYPGSDALTLVTVN